MSRGSTQKFSYWFICSFSKLKFYYSGTNACIMVEGNEKTSLIFYLNLTLNVYTVLVLESRGGRQVSCFVDLHCLSLTQDESEAKLTTTQL